MKLTTLFAVIILPASTAIAEPEPLDPSGARLVAATTYTRSPSGSRINKAGQMMAPGPRTMEGTVDNPFGKEPVNVTITVFWIRKGYGSVPRALMKKESFSTTIEVKRNCKFSSTIDEGGNIDYPWSEGWVVTVRGRDDKKLFAVKGNSAPLEQLARTPGALDALPKTSGVR